MQILQPPEWARPKGYANGIVARGRMVFLSGQIGWDGLGQFHSDDFVAQARQALENILAILAQAGGRAEHIVRLTWYIVDKHEYLANAKALGAAYTEVLGRHFPAMSVVQVAALLEDRARLEIEATAVLPEE